MYIEIGQLVDVDLFGLQLAGAFVTDVRSVATVVDLGYPFDEHRR